MKTEDGKIAAVVMDISASIYLSRRLLTYSEMGY
jgi:hypothetical protein